MNTRQSRDSAYRDLIVRTLLAYSFDKRDFPNAIKEWDYRGEVIDYHKPVERCDLCGHPVRYHFIIHNKRNRNIIRCGSECITNVMRVQTGRLTHDIKKSKLEMVKILAYKIYKMTQPLVVSIESRGLQSNVNPKATMLQIMNYTGQRKEAYNLLHKDYELASRFMKYPVASSTWRASLKPHLTQLRDLFREYNLPFDENLVAEMNRLMNEI